MKALKQDILGLPPEGMMHLSRGSHGDVVCIYLVPIDLPLGEVQDHELDKVYDGEALSCGGPRRKVREAVGLQALQKDIPALPPEDVKHRGSGSLGDVAYIYLVSIECAMNEAQDQELDKAYDDEVSDGKQVPVEM